MDLNDRLKSDLKWLMSHESGRRLIRTLMYDVCGLNHLVVSDRVLAVRDGHSSALHAFHEDGKRYIGAVLHRWLESVPIELRELMLQESFHEARLAEAKQLEYVNSPDGRA